MQCIGHCLFYPAETPNVAATCNWWPPHHDIWDVVRVWWMNILRKLALNRSTPYTCEYSPKDGAQQVYAVHLWIFSEIWRSTGLRRTLIRPSLAYRQDLLLSVKTTERHSTLQSTLSWHQSSRTRRCRRRACADRLIGKFVLYLSSVSMWTTQQSLLCAIVSRP